MVGRDSRRTSLTRSIPPEVREHAVAPGTVFHRSLLSSAFDRPFHAHCRSEASQELRIALRFCTRRNTKRLRGGHGALRRFTGNRTTHGAPVVHQLRGGAPQKAGGLCTADKGGQEHARSATFDGKLDRQDCVRPIAVAESPARRMLRGNDEVLEGDASDRRGAWPSWRRNPASSGNPTTTRVIRDISRPPELPGRPQRLPCQASPPAEVVA